MTQELREYNFHDDGMLGMNGFIIKEASEFKQIILFYLPTENENELSKEFRFNHEYADETLMKYWGELSYIKMTRRKFVNFKGTFEEAKNYCHHQLQTLLMMINARMEAEILLLRTLPNDSDNLIDIILGRK